MNALAQSLGLPTFPINDSMRVGHREMHELQYLINHGFFKSWSNHHIILKQHGRYQLLRNYSPIPELEAEAATLDALIKDHDIPIAAYQWHVNWREDNELTYPLQVEDTLATEELEVLAHIQELEPA